MAELNITNNVGSVTSGVLGADLALIKLGPASISAAGTATYTLVIVNYGPSTAGNVTVTDVMPAGLDPDQRLRRQRQHDDGGDARTAAWLPRPL